MPVTVTRTQTRTVSEGPVYQVTETCTAANSFDTSIYIYRVTDDTYSHLATVADLLNYPVGKPAAVAAKAPYYRSNTVTRSFGTVSAALKFTEDLTRKAQILCNEYAPAVDTFVGDGSPVVIVTTSTAAN